MRQLVYAMFISNNRTSCHLWWKENLVKHQKVSKFCEIDCRFFFTDIHDSQDSRRKWNCLFNFSLPLPPTLETLTKRSCSVRSRFIITFDQFSASCHWKLLVKAFIVRQVILDSNKDIFYCFLPQVSPYCGCFCGQYCTIKIFIMSQ